MTVFTKKKEYRAGKINNRLSRTYPELTVAQAYIYDYLRENAINGECQAAYSKIGKDLDVPAATILSVMTILKRKKFIKVRKGVHAVRKIPVNVYVLLK